MPFFSPIPAIIPLLFLQIYFTLSLEPRIVYMDGDQRWDTCLAGLKRSVSGESGILISHMQYGSATYNGSKNCFLTLTVPLGYRLRVRALEFVVYNGEEDGRCEKDTLHVFDHEQQPLDPARIEQLSIADRAPGRILGQFCGQYPRPAASNVDKSGRSPSIMAESTHNALTLWWHTDPNVTRSSQVEGFRLLWSAFRTRNPSEEGSRCRRSDTAEFSCKAAECIPHSLGCNSQPDCRDGSDLDTERQVEHGCEHVLTGFLTQLTGVKRLLICLVLVLSLASVCLCCCVIYYVTRRRDNEKRKISERGRQPSSLIEDEQHECGNAGKVLRLNLNEPAIMHGGVSKPPTPPSFSPPSLPLSSNRRLQANTLLGATSGRQSQQISASTNSGGEHSGGSTSTSTSAGGTKLHPYNHHKQIINLSRATQHPTIGSATMTLTKGGEGVMASKPDGGYNYLHNEQKHLLL